ncbi:MAG: sigma-70 family RNA polymerase sigma factor [Planctomycetaceae bacterium]|nr:sigma-70 family RNA polymerase sigma factor [Planctomycetaceae bacterium]
MPPADTPHHDAEDWFLRQFVQAERELLRAIMSLVPNPVDARDVLQEATVALWAKRAEYDPTRPFAIWACGFVLNQARMFLRSEARRRARLGAVAEDLLAARREELASDLDARRDHLQACLDALPSTQRKLVRGYYFEELSVNELATRVDGTVEAIYKALQRAHAALLQCVERKLRMERAG